MTSDVRNQVEMDAIVNDLIEDIEEQKEVSKVQGKSIRQLDEGQKELYQKIEALEAGLVNGTKEQGIANNSCDASIIRQRLDEIKEEVKKQPAVVHLTRQYSIFQDRLGAEQFQIIVNTIMKWVIILIGTFSFISIIKFLIHFK